MSHDDHSHGHGGHGHDAHGHGAPHDDSEDSHLHATPNPPPPGAQDSPHRAVPSPTPSHKREALRGGDGILRPISESEYFSATPEAEAIVGSHIDEYFNQPLDIFPFWETDGKPDRFHVLFSRQIEERFPVDTDIRSRIHGYGRRIFKALVMHVTVKRVSQAGALAAFAALAILGPGLFASWTGSAPMGLGLAAGAMIAAFGLYWGLQAVLFIQYRFQLENDSYELSREIVQRTRELQNLFTSARAMADQAETQFQQDGKGWGQRAQYLTRLTMWLGARMEYLEKHVQMELWRVRRERYWMRWAQRILTPLVLIIGLAVLAFEPAPATGEVGFRALQGLAVVLGALVSYVSYFRWRTPVAAIQDKLGVDGWVRYASLDVDNAVSDQVRRDKERLVEYRQLSRGGR